MRNLIKKTSKMYCKFCGKIIDNDSRFCVHCGAKLFSDNESSQEQNKKDNSFQANTEIKAENNLSIENIKSISVSPSINSKKDVLEEIAFSTTKKNISPRKIVGLVVSCIGTLILADYVSFLLTDFPLLPTIGLFRIGPLLWINSIYIHMYAIYGFVFLFVGSFFLFKSNPIVLNKIISIAIDGSVFLLFLLLVQYLFIGKNPDYDSDISYLIFQNVFSNKIIAMSLFFLTYYLIGELSGGTFGKRTARLISQNQEKDHLSLKQALMKTLVYAIPIWILTIILIINFRVLNNLNDSLILQLCQFMSFIIIFTSIFMIFISKDNKSLAERISKTLVEKRPEKSWVSEVILGTSPKIVEKNLPLTKKTDYSNNSIDNLLALHKLIDKEKRRIFSTQNETIINLIKEMITDKNSFFQVNDTYKKQYSTDLLKHLMSISSSYGTIYYYVEPFINIGVCEKDFPYKIISKEI